MWPSTIYENYKIYKISRKFENPRTRTLYTFFSSWTFRIPENIISVVFSSNWGLICSLSNREDEVSMCHFKEISFCLKNMFLGIGGPKMILTFIKNDPNFVLNLFLKGLNPHPRRQQKSPARGKTNKKTFFDDFPSLVFKRYKNTNMYSHFLYLDINVLARHF